MSLILIRGVHARESKAESDILARRFGPLIVYDIVERDLLSEKGLENSVSHQPFEEKLSKCLYH